MDGDFQQQYQDAERAYGEGDYAGAHRLASGLLEQLVDQPQDPEAQAAVLGWRAFVALLLGHIELYGRDNRNQAAGYYEQVLASQPHETLAELAEQGLERSRLSSSAISQPEPSQTTTARQPLPEMLRDPFLTDQPVASGSPTSLSTKATATAKATAMPWLESTTPEPTPAPSPDPTPEPTPEPSPQPTPEPSPDPTPDPSPEPTPEPTEIPILDLELVPEATTEPTPPPEIVVEDPLEVLAGSLLRVKIKLPDTTDGEVQQQPPRSSWIQQLRALVRRR